MLHNCCYFSGDQVNLVPSISRFYYQYHSSQLHNPPRHTHTRGGVEYFRDSNLVRKRVQRAVHHRTINIQLQKHSSPRPPRALSHCANRTYEARLTLSRSRFCHVEEHISFQDPEQDALPSRQILMPIIHNAVLRQGSPIYDRFPACLDEKNSNKQPEYITISEFSRTWIIGFLITMKLVIFRVLQS